MTEIHALRWAEELHKRSIAAGGCATDSTVSLTLSNGSWLASYRSPTLQNFFGTGPTLTAAIIELRLVVDPDWRPGPSAPSVAA